MQEAVIFTAVRQRAKATQFGTGFGAITWRHCAQFAGWPIYSISLALCPLFTATLASLNMFLILTW